MILLLLQGITFNPETISIVHDSGYHLLVQTTANCSAHSERVLTIPISCSVMLVDVTKKCFSNRLIKGMGKDLYTVSLSAITISLLKCTYHHQQHHQIQSV